MERFFRSLENEWVPVTGYMSFNDAYHAITGYTAAAPWSISITITARRSTNAISVLSL